MSFNDQHLSANYSTLVAPRKNGSSLSIASFPDDDITKEDSCLWVPRKRECSLSFPDDNTGKGHWTDNRGNRIVPVQSNNFSMLMAPKKSGSSLSIASFPDDDFTMEESSLWVPRKIEGSSSIAPFSDDKMPGKKQTDWSNGQTLNETIVCKFNLEMDLDEKHH